MKRLFGCLTLALVLSLLAAGAAAWWAMTRVEQPYRAFPGDAAMVVIEPGTASVHILELLEQRGVIADARLARLYLRLVLRDPPLQAGEYRFEGAASLPTVLDKLVRGDVVDHTVTIVEGLTLEETAEALANAGFGDREVLLAAMRDPAAIADLDGEAESLEGYLFPSTYRFRRGTGEAEIVATMVDTFRRTWAREIAPLVPAQAASGEAGRSSASGRAAPATDEPIGGDREVESPAESSTGDAGAPDSRQADPGGGADRVDATRSAGDGSPVRAANTTGHLGMRGLVILASLVEKEARIESERPLIAAVYANRLKLGMGLYADPTVVYALKLEGRWDGNIRREDLRMDSPYNTYRHAGLPPGPIASPGLASLRAAARPADITSLYFVSRNDGTHVFADTLAEHNRNVDRWQRRYWREQRRQSTPPPAE